MVIIRPIEPEDIEALLDMASKAGVGVTTLPPNRALLEAKIRVSVQSFSQQIPEDQAQYLFALEDVDVGRIIGVSAILARVGQQDVWYNYRVSTTVSTSRELDIHKCTPTLYLTNDMTGSTEICTLFLDPDYRHRNNGQLLSKCRFMFIDDHSNLFASKIFAEMRGVSDDQGRSPFWQALGHHFFSIDFSEADYLTGIGQKSFIAELMPKYPIYLPMLGAEAQAAVGKVHQQTRPALAMLESEGFNFNGLIDIFDGGPLVEVFVNSIRTIRDSFNRQAFIVKHVDTDVRNSAFYMVSNRSFSCFRVGLITGDAIKSDTVSLSAELAERLRVNSGDVVRLTALRDPRQRRN
ncbi:arginine N-succinyltransferase subunit beta [Oleiphilus messinensis]|uniref:Arginine N-succinyltransferase n=1 Tax=Oleiphilus messinensis TaxID=141451 RepID=A0A1Y0I5A3_9GAMM|nr:arginine N-succinyltransferase [Oleiphilus messinensis]ARU55591.1 arginine N-succinyltransferase subunit beta [Oleiphilus messinensis]